ncbi:DUF4232 domain-containing protein [Bordetella genomosp. 11]|uniref:DUF4232 domain-containing protein n=1 Tax=Bordetella genomosp. 11 TaxID=1416808 RepID=A0A261UHQ8_9BORD|nr:DUF4232 domain-containing protein [Bordetella genomosp. 11]OZI61131.1 hypothetical protein CAL28_17460 [Bordetella genomosp. 11]
MKPASSFRKGLAASCLVLCATLATAAARAAEPTCDPAQLSFAADREGGQFDGTSHSGTLVVLRNLGPNTCTVPMRPEVGFLDGANKPLRVAAQSSIGMHPGPVMPQVAIPVGAELTSEVRWVSGDVYGDPKQPGNCVSPAFITLTLGVRVFVAPFTTRLCGPAGKPPSYSATPLHRDPPYVPAAR